MINLNDDDCPGAIKSFVRENQDIEVTEYIKRGANGEVYFGKRRKMGDEVVLKFYWSSPEYNASEEAVILRGITHENVLKIHHLSFVHPHYAYFLTPRISGGDLQGIIDQQPLPTKKALSIVADILIGLTELHSKHGLVHRDLKPGNILINLPEHKAIIADLGAVKKMDKEYGYVSASKSTYLYLPPESISDNKYYFQSDIYQVCIILYQLLGGKFPINSPEEWLSQSELKRLNATNDRKARSRMLEDLLSAKIAKGKLIDLDQLPPYLDKKFKRVISKATNKDYTKRYNNTGEFLKDIYELIQQQPNFHFKKETLHIQHEGGKQYRIFENKNKFVIEKSIKNGVWRKVLNHNGTYEDCINNAKK